MSSQKFASLRYTASRVGLLVACFAVVWVLCYWHVIPFGANGSNLVWMVLLALILSAPLSWVLLRKQRDAMSEQIVERVDRAKARMATNAGQEDGV
ncbi:DUF4229 domain-containing protein [Streptomyces albireticuli]|uniref:DUF4229 domain-containing protein n=1 Tax=Streptomyces albireticuli TaxID=1940 RepID=A0A2A2DAP2_9ACTN|nr:DUF4229 domain-containing protein [Streptomyces albireticuli]MCD9144825.1 DUF4229 domain-containing protein [Streptomyces albireticuli]MCD9165694.1 DUF4229 domain-containing protein [Streptomyces albireticuli]MCD9193732.1 DUF4229 domain-containing protein [Streptomyces albireticuli]PAU48430.1 hypothetical protein CK936_13345 [Streptomyces albireticuli]